MYCLVFESAREARMPIIVFCIASAKSTPLLIFHFANTLPLYLIHTLMVWHFSKNPKLLLNEVVLQESRANAAQDAQEYTCLILEKHMAIRVRTISFPESIEPVTNTIMNDE